MTTLERLKELRALARYHPYKPVRLRVNDLARFDDAIRCIEAVQAAPVLESVGAIAKTDIARDYRADCEAADQSLTAWCFLACGSHESVGAAAEQPVGTRVAIVPLDQIEPHAG